GCNAPGGFFMRVLIVDDDPEVRDVLAEAFRMEGLDVLEASNGLEALLYVKRDRPDAVVLDLMMPRLGGVEALKRIHDFNPGIRVLVVTGTDDPELHRQATASGASAVFTKPVAIAALVAALAAPALAAAPPVPPAPRRPAAGRRCRSRRRRRDTLARGSPPLPGPRPTPW